MVNKLRTTCKSSHKILSNLSTIVFWGSLWGIIEVTLGYLLHKINFSFGWCIWFPLAFYFMDKIYRKTGKVQYILYGAIVTSAIKLTNLFIEVRIDKVINPAISILFEAIALLVIYKVIEKKNKKIGIIEILIVNVFWRCLYSIYIFIMPSSFLAISPLAGLDSFLRFILLESSVNAIFIMTYILFRDKTIRKFSISNRKELNVSPIQSFLMCLFAILVQIIV
ncbi:MULTISPECIES: hypothetical protein [unclassified Clostridium]|uniref:hypothetical protein n=1 Tax=unclassified Clostridium TaxID=2614128 RepID=UPI000297FEAB|nr:MULTISPECIES: hypothetical protein [unclassified Clostridium]EKQ52836.1 MAG: hypothetical protein A370_03992 [Clostridium sp. Maddingley MBC34-26]